MEALTVEEVVFLAVDWHLTMHPASFFIHYSPLFFSFSNPVCRVADWAGQILDEQTSAIVQLSPWMGSVLAAQRHGGWRWVVSLLSLPPACWAVSLSAGISLHVPTLSGGLNSLPRFDKEGRNPSNVWRLRFAESISAWVYCYRSPKMHQIDISRSAPRGFRREAEDV